LINIINTIIIWPESHVNNSSQDAPRYYVDLPIDLNEFMDLDHTIEKRAFMDITDQQLKVELATINVECLTQDALAGTNLLFLPHLLTRRRSGK